MNTMKFKRVDGWGIPPKQGVRPRSVADVSVDSHDNIYLFTRDDNRVEVYDREGNYVKDWGDNRFGGRAHGITLGPDDSVYCVNDLDHTVRKFTTEGKLLMTIGTAGVASDTGYDRSVQGQHAKNATIKRSGSPFNRPTRLAVAPNGDLYVSDGYGNARVHRFSGDGRLLKSWGDPGAGAGQFMVVHGIGLDADGRVLVADRENDRIQIFTADGEYLDQWTGLSRPTSLFIDRAGYVYVTETGWAFDPEASPTGVDDLPMRVSIFDRNGNIAARWDYEVPPHGICADSRGDIYVASNNRRGRTGSTGAVIDYSLLKYARQL